MALRLFLVEDDARLLTELNGAWGQQTNLSITGTASRVSDSIALLRRGLDFDVALVDLGLPDGSGAEVIACIRKLKPNALPIAFTVFDDAPAVLNAMRSGARGYLLKSTPLASILLRLEEAVVGGAPMSPPVARLVVEALSDDAGPPSQLSKREREVLTLLSKGVRYADIGTMLGIGLGTVQIYVKRIYEKLEIGTKAEAAAIAAKWGLV